MPERGPFVPVGSSMGSDVSFFGGGGWGGVAVKKLSAGVELVNLRIEAG